MDCGCAKPKICVTLYCSATIAIFRVSRACGSSSRCLQAPPETPWCSGPLPSWKLLCTQRDPIAARSSRWKIARIIAVARDDVILPERTLRLLDRNVLRFVESRDQLRGLGQSTRKGILLYGPPGTGKTHTIRYLATNLPGHTTLIITA